MKTITLFIAMFLGTSASAQDVELPTEQPGIPQEERVELEVDPTQPIIQVHEPKMVFNKTLKKEEMAIQVLIELPAPTFKFEEVLMDRGGVTGIIFVTNSFKENLKTRPVLCNADPRVKGAMPDPDGKLWVIGTFPVVNHKGVNITQDEVRVSVSYEIQTKDGGAESFGDPVPLEWRLKGGGASGAGPRFNRGSATRLAVVPK